MGRQTLFFDRDANVILLFTVQDASGKAYDLTGATVTMLVAGQASLGAAITAPLQGECQVTVPANTYPVGVHAAQLRVQFTGKTYHTELFTLQVGAAV